MSVEDDNLLEGVHLRTVASLFFSRHLIRCLLFALLYRFSYNAWGSRWSSKTCVESWLVLAARFFTCNSRA